LKGKS
jgi:hypothetical protein